VPSVSVRLRESERGETQTLVSRRCPSIRDGYGEPLTQRRVEEKLAQAGGARSLAARMGLKSGRTLVLEHYTRLADVWRELFVEHPLEAVVTAYESPTRSTRRSSNRSLTRRRSSKASTRRANAPRARG
jgi:hypothetical protein